MSALSLPLEIDSVPISHPDKELYPESHLTKRMLAEYYEKAAAHLLPGVERRPLSLLTCPQGRKNCFFQKHLNYSGDFALPTVSIEESRGKKRYSYIDRSQHLIQLVQLNVLELHPWNSRVDRLAQPDQMIFDFDPGPGINDSSVIEAALTMRLLLKEFSLESFVRVTGGKGIHVLVPLQPRQTFAEVKKFAGRVAAAFAAADPARFIAKAVKTARVQRIYVDYLRNSQGATAIANYSTRAREGAPVAVPLSWNELDGQRTIPKFYLDDVLRRLKRQKSDPWKRRDQVARALPKI